MTTGPKTLRTRARTRMGAGTPTRAVPPRIELFGTPGERGGAGARRPARGLAGRFAIITAIRPPPLPTDLPYVEPYDIIVILYPSKITEKKKPKKKTKNMYASITRAEPTSTFAFPPPLHPGPIDSGPRLLAPVRPRRRPATLRDGSADSYRLDIRPVFNFRNL